MDDELKNTDWYDMYPQEAVNYIFSQPDFESGFTAFKFFMTQYPDLDIDWIDIFREFDQLLLKTEKIDEILHFIEWVSGKDLDYQDDLIYTDQNLCSYFLFKNELTRLKEQVDVLQKHPVADFNAITEPLLFELIYHGHYELAISYAEAVYNQVRESDELVDNAEYPFIMALYINKLQEKYEAWKENGLFDEGSFIKDITELGFEEDRPTFNKIVEYLKNPLDLSEIEGKIKKNKLEYLLALNIHFLKYMLEKYNLPFIVSEQFWDMVNTATLFGEKKKTNRWFFVGARKLEKYIDDRLDFYESNLLEVFGKVWGLDYVYKFLYDQKLINTEDYTVMQTNIGAIKKALIEEQENGLWQMTFIFKWPRVHELAGFEKEEDFRATFGMTKEAVDEEWEVAKSVNFEEDFGQFYEDFLADDEFGEDDELERDYAPQVPFVREGPKIGRNDPCPCGSGKKYKKCCGS